MDEGNLPEWLTEQEDGSVSISFEDARRKPKIDGTEISELTMREPTIEDQLAQQKKHKHMGDAEVALIANLTEQSPDAIRGLSVRHFSRCQRALAFFNFG